MSHRRSLLASAATATAVAGLAVVPLALAHAGSSRAVAPVETGSTAVNLPAAVVTAITGDGITPSVVEAGQGLAGPSGSLYAVFPVTGGKVKLNSGAIAGGDIAHRGGLDFAGNVGGKSADLKITDFDINLATGGISARAALTVGGKTSNLGRIGVFQLGGVTASVTGHRATGSATAVKLTAAAAGALNALGTNHSAFSAGDSVGTASFVAIVGRAHRSH